MDSPLKNKSTVDPATGRARETIMPSEVARPTRSDSVPQQASTSPGDGGKSHSQESPTNETKVPWKDQVIGYGKLTRGKLLGQKETQETGHQILQGNIVPTETHKNESN